ncbi:MAG: VOC family protein [Deltaproteobacteria bacterium]|nr:VOC family protein [Deltaproteobacteria bacterium]MBI3077253.1 VOC family protein [Deltaproteobacteria bacterium]
MAVVTGLDHAVLTVRDINRSLRWYRQVLGLQLRWDGRRLRGHRMTFLGDRSGSFLVLLEKRTRQRGNLQGLDHLAFSVRDIEAARRAVERRGVTITGEREDEDGRGKSYYFEDPDGQELEIYGPIRRRRR